MKNTVHIPATIEEATETLTGIESLLTKKGWERAAIVAAFVRLPGQGARTDLTSGDSPKSAEQFSALGISGLRDPKVVRAYVQNWLDEHNGIYPEPGADVVVPKTPWPPTGSESVGEPPFETKNPMDDERRQRLLGAGVGAGMKSGAKVVDVAANPKSLAIAIENDEDTFKAAEAAVERRKADRLREAIIKAGGDPDMPKDDLGIDMTSIETRRIVLGIRSLASDVRGLHRRSETDQWFIYQTHLAQAAEVLNQSIQGIKIPDSLEGVDLS